MFRYLLVILTVTAALLSSTAVAQTRKPAKPKDGETEKAEKAYQEMVEKRRATESAAEKLALTQKFLDEYPETSRTASALGAAFYYQGEDIGDVSGAVSYAETIRARIGDPEIAKAVDKEMLYVYGTAKMFPKLTEVAARLAAEGALDFSDHTTIIEAATNAGEWKLALEHCDKARGLATAEAFRKQYPDKKLRDEDVEKAVKAGAGMLLVMGGWARANLGDVDRALADFAEADKIVARSYVGTGEHNLNLYWGETLLMTGNHAAAAEKLAVGALVMRDEKALAGLKKAYAATRGGEAGFDAYAAELHRSIAKNVGDFELGDYSGKRHRLSGLRKDVTLLAFWFPT